MTEAGYLASDYELVLPVVPVAGAARTSRTTPTSRVGTRAAACSTSPTRRSPATRRCRSSRAGCAEPPRTPECATSTRAGSSTATRCAPTTRWCAASTSRSGVWNENAARQSFHPNARGHGAFAECMTQFYNSGLQQATCVDPASTGHGTLYNGLLEFKQLRNAGTGKLRRRQGLRLAQQHSAAVVHLPRRAQPGLLVRPGAADPALRAVPRPVPGRGRRRRSAPAPRSTSTTATAAPTRSACSPATRSSRRRTRRCAWPSTARCSADAAAAAGDLRVGTRQQWSFESRNFPNPVGLRPRRLHRRPRLLTALTRRSWTYVRDCPMWKAISPRSAGRAAGRGGRLAVERDDDQPGRCRVAVLRPGHAHLVAHREVVRPARSPAARRPAARRRTTRSG